MSKALYLKNLKCYETEDFTFDDIKLEVNGESIVFTSMDEGEVVPVKQYVRFDDKAVVKLWEVDLEGADDLLGEHTVRGGSGMLTFNRDDALYRLSYEVE